MTTATLQETLAQLLGPGGVAPADEAHRHAFDGVVPHAVARPSSREEVIALMRLASRDGLAVVPSGGRTAIGRGNPPERLDVLLSTCRLDRILEYEPADLTATVQAGVTLEQLNRRLGEEGQMVPWDSPNAHRATLGGVIAANVSGPRRLAYGTPRDRLIGVTVVDATGTLIKGGGKVVKNVAGYDMPKLFAGSLGTLGVIVECTLKLAPMPKARATVVGAFAKPEAALEASQTMLRGGLRPTALEVLNGAAYRTAAARARLPSMSDRAYFAAVEAGGSPAAVDRQKTQAHRAVTEAGGKSLLVEESVAQEAFWRGVVDAGYALNRPAVMVTRSSARHGELLHLIHGHEALGESSNFEVAVLVHAGEGVVRSAWWNETGTIPDEGLLAEAVGTLRKATALASGPFWVESCSPSLKHTIDVWGEPAPAFAIMRRLKEQFDPSRILSPGRFVGGL